MPSEKPWTSSSALPRNWILTKIMPPDCLAWQPGGVFVCGGFDGYGMTRRNVVYLPIYSRFQSTCHIRGMTLAKTIEDYIRNISIHMPHTWHDALKDLEARGVVISIHMPHTWHDVVRGQQNTLVLISIHMPHTWHDNFFAPILRSRRLFQSTCHIRGMTYNLPNLL